MDEYVSSYIPDLLKTGDVEAVAVEGNTLWYQYVPEDDLTSVTVMYYRAPELLSNNTDTPSDFPSFLHRKLFIYGAAWLIYNEIEDGIDGEKINTKSAFWESFDTRNRDSGITQLREWVGRSNVHLTNSIWDY